ncbi:MAG: hypothetical protein PHS93_10260, partial [Candidatus Omnitrophica bacterium]|nr:hypothetical protein [Candidatus Omnitrophota bacterium]
MRTISLSHFEDIISEIVKEREETSKIKREVFTGVSKEELLKALKTKLGDDFTVKKIPPKITEEDFKTIANGRYLKHGGIKYLGGWMISVLAILYISGWYPVIQPYHYIVLGLITIGFMFLYRKKQ